MCRLPSAYLFGKEGGYGSHKQTIDRDAEQRVENAGPSSFWGHWRLIPIANGCYRCKSEKEGPIQVPLLTLIARISDHFAGGKSILEPRA